LNNTRAIALLKKIELSKGYDNYRKNRVMTGTSKPPILLSKKIEVSRNNHSSTLLGQDFSPSRITLANKSKELSCFKTLSAVTPYRSVSIFNTISKIGGLSYFCNDQLPSDSHYIELTEAQEKILNIIFEHFSHIDDATKKRVIKAQHIVEIFGSLSLPVVIDRKDIDISAKRIKSNMNSHLTFEQFTGVLEDICIRQLGFDTFMSFIELHLFKYTQNLQEHTADLTKISQTQILQKSMMTLELENRLKILTEDSNCKKLLKKLKSVVKSYFIVFSNLR
jgi:hypothetical protein